MVLVEIEEWEKVNKQVCKCDGCGKRIEQHYFNAMELRIPAVVKHGELIEPEQVKHFCNRTCIFQWVM